MSAVGSLISEIEESFRAGTSERRAATLRRISALFLAGADDFGEQQVALFDEVLCQLVTKIERAAIVELSNSIAPVANAPRTLTRQLSRHDDVAIAGPVLRQSPLLNDNDLIEIAKSRGQPHLVAIAGRRRVSESVSDVLIDRGNSEVLATVGANLGARFSIEGYARLLGKAEQDADVAAVVAPRADLPPEMFRKLVARATAMVQQRLMATADPAMRVRIQAIVQEISLQLVREAAGADAKIDVRRPASVDGVDKNKLRSELSDYAAGGRLAESVIALAALSGVSGDIIRRLMSQAEAEALLIICKASHLGWSTARAVIDLAAKISDQKGWNSADYLERYTKMTVESAQRVIRFLNARKTIAGGELKKMMAL